MSAAFLVRPFKPANTDAVISLWNNELPSNQSWNEPANVIRRKLNADDGLFFVGDLDGRIIATVMAGYDGIRGWIYSLAVANACRRQGYGSQMMRHAEEALHAKGCQKINLQVRATNSEIIAFYERLGYSVEDRTSMGKPLPRTDEAASGRQRMMFMVIETFKDGQKTAVYQRYKEKGRMQPEGLRYIDSWVEAEGNRCFQLMEADRAETFDEWTANWDDLMDFEIVPIVPSPTKQTTGDKCE